MAAQRFSGIKQTPGLAQGEGKVKGGVRRGERGDTGAEALAAAEI